MIDTLLNISYAGEHLGLKYSGETFVLIAILSSLLTFGFYIAYNITGREKLRKTARIFYTLHLISIVNAAIILFIILFGLNYEFSYVWQHTASYLDTKYIISAFWAGQEGSFLLWAFLEGVLGLMVMTTAGKHESYVMPVISIGQFFLVTMIWGVKLGNFIIGQSPFTLLREMPQNVGVDFFNNPNYLQQIADGNGINPLLENVWMVTHPPLLFLGYSAALIPFAYVIAALWRGDFRSWIKPALPWTIFAVISLGGGILLGGAWAYESLTFGGFWSWDPVENASLIPWLFIVAALHTIIINKKRNHSYALSFLFVIMGYVFVIYASYLTRSGVLGETSAHAFGNNGLSAQMVMIILLTLIFSLFLYFKNYHRFSSGKINDKFFSREFWMYLGALTLVLAAFQIFATTSIPVFNKIFGTSIAPPADRVAFYNQWQLPFAVVIVLLIGGAMILRYGRNDEKSFFKRFTYVFGISAILFFVQIFVFNITGWTLLVFLLFINFAMVSAVYSLIFSKINLSFMANFLSHFGFVLFLLGVLVAFSKADIISRNTSHYDLEDSKSNRENQVLMRGIPEKLGDYWVVYDSMRREKNYLHYTIKFYKDRNLENPVFTIHPDININNRMGNVYNPYTHHTVSKDIFTFITYADLASDYNNYDYLVDNEAEITLGDSIITGAGILVFRNISLVKASDSIDINNIIIKADFGLWRDTVEIPLSVEYRIVNGQKSFGDAVFDEGKYFLRFENIAQKPKTINIGLFKKRLNYIVIKTTVFPWISLMLVGGLLMFIGLFVSLAVNMK